MKKILILDRNDVIYTSKYKRDYELKLTDFKRDCSGLEYTMDVILFQGFFTHTVLKNRSGDRDPAQFEHLFEF